MNRAVLVGRITKDPELRGTTSGVSVCSFTVACDRAHTKEKQADFIGCIAWRQQAEFVAKYFKKGDRIALEGSIQTRTWDDMQGNKRYATEVSVDHVEFAQSKTEGAGYTPQTPVNGMTEAPSVPDGNIAGFMPADDEDLPF